MAKLMRSVSEASVKFGKWQMMAAVLDSEIPLRVIFQSHVLHLFAQRKSNNLDRLLENLYASKMLSGHEFIKTGFLFGKPIEFQRADGSRGYGIEAERLVDICRLLLRAREFGVLKTQKELAIAQIAESFIVSFAQVGIVALIDEATGYEKVRDRDSLRKILDKYLKKEHAAWAKRFPDEFYTEIFRLRGWTWKGMTVNRPSVVGTYTKDIVYARLAPEILKELEKRNPKNDKGYRQAKHHQWMTDDIGHPALNNHIHGVLALMRISDDWVSFGRHLKKAFPRIGDQLELLGLDDSDLS